MTTYATVAVADIYFNTVLKHEIWNMFSSEKKQRALNVATQHINGLNFSGDKADEDQELEFPRGDDETVPDAIINACCEEAYELANGRDLDLELASMQVSSVGWGNAKTANNPELVPENLMNGILSLTAWYLLRPYLRDSTFVRLRRID